MVANTAQWREFANKKRAKRTKTDNTVNDFNRAKIIVQKMSSEVSQKRQKYSHVGTKEYVPFDSYHELNVPIEYH